jgi:hypothetical protein
MNNTCRMRRTNTQCPRQHLVPALRHFWGTAMEGLVPGVIVAAAGAVSVSVQFPAVFLFLSFLLVVLWSSTCDASLLARELSLFVAARVGLT